MRPRLPFLARFALMVSVSILVSLVSSVPAAAVPGGDVTAPPPELAAVDFLTQVGAFASRLGDDAVIPASAVFFKDTASFSKAVKIGAPLLRRIYEMKISRVERKGLRYILVPSGQIAEGLPPVLIMFSVNGVFRIDLAGSFSYKPPAPPDPDPRNHFPSLDESLAGVAGEGPLTAIFNFGPGAQIRCRLLPDEAPRTVASFVAMARGLRSIRVERDVEGSAVPEFDWVKRPWYDGSRAVPAFGRRVLRIGSSRSTGFVIPDEFSVSRRHDSPALLTTLPFSPDRWGGTVAITTGPVPALDDVGTIFGICDESQVDRLDRIWRIRKGEPAIPALLNIRIVKK